MWAREPGRRAAPMLGEHGKKCAANPQGRALVDCLATQGYALLSTHFHQMITTTTYSKAAHRSQLDHLLVRSKDIQWHKECQNTGSNLGTNSPHSAVHTILKVPTRSKPIPIKRRTARAPPKRDYQKLETAQTCDNEFRRTSTQQMIHSLSQTQKRQNNNSANSETCTAPLQQ